MSTKPSKVIVVSASSDIGAAISERFIDSGCEVLGTYRKHSAAIDELERKGMISVKCDIGAASDIETVFRLAQDRGFKWDTILFSPGQLSPIGPFFSTDFEAWIESVQINSLYQLKFLHQLYPLRDSNEGSNVLFFAGGGTNGTFDNYSAYCLGKIMLIKMCELLDSECPDMKAAIIGPGWVHTKGHQETVLAGAAAGANHQRTIDYLDSDKHKTSYDEIFSCLMWCLNADRAAIGGRNLSLVHDPWQANGKDLMARLLDNKDLYKLRRSS